MVDRALIEKIANLAKLQIPEPQQAAIAENFKKIIKHFEELAAVDTENVEPMVTPHQHNALHRPDEVVDEVGKDEILANAPDLKDNLFKVPPVV